MVGPAFANSPNIQFGILFHIALICLSLFCGAALCRLAYFWYLMWKKGHPDNNSHADLEKGNTSNAPEADRPTYIINLRSTEYIQALIQGQSIDATLDKK